jgi:glycerophosphoryl diester phosphodiesterase
MKIISHRGARGLAPENTIKGIEKAMMHNVDEIEIDVRVTKDNQVILNHDEELTDASGNKLLIKEANYQELKKHKADLTTLDEAIAVINKKIPLHIEIKPTEPTEEIIKIIKSYLAKGWQDSNFLIASYDQKVLLTTHAALPGIKKVVVETWSSWSAIRRAKAVDTKRLSMNQLWLWSYFIKSMTKSGWQLSAYTLNDASKAKRWAKLGLYAAITDYPDLMKK